MKEAQRKQHLIKLNDKKETEDFFKFLEQNSYKNIQNLSFESLRIKVVVVDHNQFFATNATCLAAAVTKGLRLISVKQFKQKLENYDKRL